MHQGPGLGAEMLPAAAAPIGLRLPTLDLQDVVTLTVRAADALGPAGLDKPRLGGFVVREHPHDLQQRHAPPVRPPRPLPARVPAHQPRPLSIYGRILANGRAGVKEMDGFGHNREPS